MHGDSCCPVYREYEGHNGGINVDYYKKNDIPPTLASDCEYPSQHIKKEIVYGDR